MTMSVQNNQAKTESLTCHPSGLPVDSSDFEPHLIYGSLDQQESASQTASRSRSINVSKAMNKEMLVQLAYQHIVPQPQRKYRANRRGLAMAAKQKKRAAALNILKYHDTSASQTYIIANSRQSVAGSSSIRSSSSPGDVQYHLKPPVSAINMEHKVIKLTSSKTTSSSSSSRDAGNMQNSHHLKQLSASESSIVSNTSGDSSSTSSRKIRLCQPGHASAAEKPQQHQTVGVVTASTLPAKRTSGDAGETEKKKFKATAITWP